MTDYVLTMGELPPELATARVLSGEFRGLSMVVASDGYPDSWFVLVRMETGDLPVQLGKQDFLAVACKYERDTHIVLRRCPDRLGWVLYATCSALSLEQTVSEADAYVQKDLDGRRARAEIIEALRKPISDEAAVALRRVLDGD